MKGRLYWITGLSGAGKTTIGSKLYEYLKSQKSNVIFLDGDKLREVYQSTDYTLKGRKALTYQHARLCKLLTEQGIDVVLCVIAMFDECREWNRNNIENYHEIYLKVSLDTLIQRDQKHLYSKALRNEIDNVLGVNAPFEEPKFPELIIENDGGETPDEILNKIISFYSL